MIDLLTGDALTVLRTLPAEHFHCCVTSPPYWGLRDYGVAGQLGLEADFEEYPEKLVAIFEEVRRVLRQDGTAWVNMGDCFSSGSRTTGYNDPGWIKTGGRCEGGPQRKVGVSGCKPKDLIGQPWRLAFALRDAGWYLRSEIIWHKPNPMPESVTDRPTKSHEQIFLLAKSERYYYDADAVREPHDPASIARAEKPWRGNSVRGHPSGQGQLISGGRADGAPMDTCHPLGRNKRTVWTVPTAPFAGAHFATFPPDMIKPCILAGCPEGGHVLDPFAGAGTTGLVADRLGRNATLIELNPQYVALARERIKRDCPMFTEVS